MFSTIKSWFTTELHHIIADITSTVEQLHAHADAKLAAAEQHLAQATESTSLAQDANAVAAKAKGIAEKLTALVS